MVLVVGVWKGLECCYEVCVPEVAAALGAGAGGPGPD